MRAFLMDEIDPSDMEKITGFLKESGVQSSLRNLFWVKIPKDLLAGIQFEHFDCAPHVFAIEVGRDWIKAEFFIRSMKDMRCHCQSYCTPQQRDFILNFAQRMIEELGIRT